MTVDTDGYLYVATQIGLQICDQAGRVVAIVNKPQDGRLTNVVFAGPDMQTLYVTAGERCTNGIFAERVFCRGPR